MQTEKKYFAWIYSKESSEAGRVHDNYMGYEYSFHSSLKKKLHELYIAFAASSLLLLYS